MKTYPLGLRETFDIPAKQLSISSITLGQLHYGAEKSTRRAHNLTAIENFVARLDVLPFAEKAQRTMVRSGQNWSAWDHRVVRTTCKSAVMPAVRG